METKEKKMTADKNCKRSSESLTKAANRESPNCWCSGFSYTLNYRIKVRASLGAYMF